MKAIRTELGKYIPRSSRMERKNRKNDNNQGKVRTSQAITCAFDEKREKRRQQAVSRVEIAAQ